MPLPNIPPKSLVILSFKASSDEDRGRLARARAAFQVGAECGLGICDLFAGEDEGEFLSGCCCRCAEVDYYNEEQMVSVEMGRVHVATCKMYVVNLYTRVRGCRTVEIGR